MVKFNLKVAEFRRRYLGKHGIAEAVTLAVITAMIGWFNHFMRIDMTESMEILFRECDGASDYDHLCQYVCHSPDGRRGSRLICGQDNVSVADGQLPLPRDCCEDGSGRDLIRM